ncbi:MAG TPA: PLD nuclease N-terminal domain-containing protein [Gaiellaceae bacterium]
MGHALVLGDFFDQGFFRSLILLALAFCWGFALFDLVRHPMPGPKKAAWLMLIVLIPFVGAIVYFVVRKTPEYTPGENAGLTQHGDADLRLTTYQHPGV